MILNIKTAPQNFLDVAIHRLAQGDHSQTTARPQLGRDQSFSSPFWRSSNFLWKTVSLIVARRLPWRAPRMGLHIPFVSFPPSSSSVVFFVLCICILVHVSCYCKMLQYSRLNKTKTQTYCTPNPATHVWSNNLGYVWVQTRANSLNKAISSS